MSSSRKIAEFPDVEAKLQKPTKKSVFERQREEAEAKRRREEAETAAVLKDFVKSFDRDGDRDRDRDRDSRFPPSRNDRPPNFDRPPGYVGGTGKRHFGLPSASQGLKSGPGSLGPAPSTFGKKRSFDGFAERDRAEALVGHGRLAFDQDADPRHISKVFETSEDDEEVASRDRAEEKAVSKPTLRLANLPPGSSQSLIKSLIPANIAVENIKILPPAGPGATERKSTTAIVTLSPETAATDIDAAVSALQNRYIGFGYYLSLHRHLSSAAISGSLATSQPTVSSSHPFGAKPVPQTRDDSSNQPRGHSRGFAPPTSYGPSSSGHVSRVGILHVAVTPPKDIKQLRMIHMVVESILQNGPEFEALLMSRPDVQREEKWSWIWDARSEGGIWYRYRLWEVITGAKSQRGRGKFTPLFDGGSAWKLPDQPLPYEYTARVDEFVSDSEYNSSDDEDFFDEPLGRPGEAGTGGTAAGNDNDESVLSPLDKAKLVHLLARLPTTLSKLRKGDIARATAFAITHASRGADEVVDLIVSNVEKPFAFSSANLEHKSAGRSGRDEKGPSREISPAAGEKRTGEPQDDTTARLIALYVISDILSSSSTSGIRHAWRYRQHFEAALRSRKVFEGLGMVPERMGWGRLRAEKWKRSVGLVLGHWEGWCVFPAETQAFLVDSFENPPALAEAQRAKEAKDAEDAAAKKSKWKTVDAVAAATKAADEAGGSFIAAGGKLAHARAGSGDADESGDEPYLEYTDDEDADLELLEDEDIDGEPFLDTGMAGMSMAGEEDIKMAGVDGVAAELPEQPATKKVGGFEMSAAAVNPKKRMRAMDMFASSDSEMD